MDLSKKHENQKKKLINLLIKLSLCFFFYLCILKDVVTTHAHADSHGKKSHPFEIK